MNSHRFPTSQFHHIVHVTFAARSGALHNYWQSIFKVTCLCETNSWLYDV